MVFPYSDDNKRYHTLHYYNKTVYGCRVVKAAVDAGRGCPNGEGCVFCNKNARDRRSVFEQFDEQKSRILAKFPDAKILLYLGVGTNTLGSAKELEKLLSDALKCKPFALSIATRADCLDEEKSRLLASVELPLTVELGLQTVHDSTAKIINRGHSFGDFLCGFELLKSLKIRTCVHIMNGLPGEDIPMMLKTAETLGRLRPDALKIHMTYVEKGTPLFEMYVGMNGRGEYSPMEKDEYIETVVRQLELIPPETVIERVTGDADKALLAAPLWSADKISVLGGIDKKMADMDTYQGRLFKGNQI